MHQWFDVAVVGGGMVGASLAVALAQTSLKVALLEPQPVPEALSFPPELPADVDLRVSAISLASQCYLDALGAWDSIPKERRANYRSMCIWDAEGSGEVHFDAETIPTTALGSIVENAQILNALDRIASELPNLCRFSQPLASVEQLDERVEITLASGDAIAAHLLIAADGARSKTRALAGIDVRSWSYEQRALVATVQTELPHRATAYQRFSPIGPLAFLPLGPEHLCSIVWSLDEEAMDSIEGLSPENLKQRLSAALDYRLGRVVDFSEKAVFPLNQCHAKRYTKGRIVLVGDAAHSIHPLAGQGVNLGFADAAVLVEEISRGLKRGKALGDAGSLMAYERRRMPENLAAMAAMESFKRLFGVKALPVILARNLGMKAFEALPWAKHHSMLVAMGLVGDLTDSLKTKNLGFPRLDL